eukprot:scaffold227851_cov30-Tisochrysis_lutea.AAC.3
MNVTMTERIEAAEGDSPFRGACIMVRYETTATRRDDLSVAFKRRARRAEVMEDLGHSATRT